LSESQIPAGESQLFGEFESSMTTKEFLDAGIETTLDMIGCSWNRWVSHEAKKIGYGIAK
jgi:hypothetical protein